MTETVNVRRGYAIELAPHCTVREAAAFKQALHAAEDSSGDCIVDAGRVERVDTAALQLLLGFAAHLRVMERRLVWGSVSPAFSAGVRQLGLADLLELPGPA